ncbi:MAG: SRPBCC family protein [Gemmatimonadaceae bacterium]
MSRIFVWRRAIIPASPLTVYDILSDYRGGHQAILPREHFSHVTVERGGFGAGTLVRFQMRVLGATSTHRVMLAEPQPGRMLTETDLDAGAVTTFTILPKAGGRATELTIATEWESRGLRGWLEQLLAPPVLRRIYAAEMRNLTDLVSTRFLRSA